eukprot:gene33914-41832_t
MNKTKTRSSWANSLASLGPRFLPFADAASDDLPLSRLLRLSLFQISVGMAMVMLVGTLNRVMIVELQVPATPGQFELGVATQCGRCESCARDVVAQCSATHPMAAVHNESVPQTIQLASSITESKAWTSSLHSQTPDRFAPAGGLSRNTVIVSSVVLFHVAAIWALQSGLVRKAAEIIVPAELLSEFINPPAPKVAPPPPKPAPTPPAPKTAPKVQAPKPAPMPLAINDPTPAPNAPTGATTPQPPAPPITEPVAAAPAAPHGHRHVPPIAPGRRQPLGG